MSKKLENPNLDPNSSKFFDRCLSSVCAPCRKHASCFIYPVKDKCLGQEIGPTWNHVCKASADDLDYSDID